MLSNKIIDYKKWNMPGRYNNIILCSTLWLKKKYFPRVIISKRIYVLRDKTSRRAVNSKYAKINKKIQNQKRKKNLVQIQFVRIPPNVCDDKYQKSHLSRNIGRTSASYTRWAAAAKQ